jgi:hypothetical protein
MPRAPPVTTTTRSATSTRSCGTGWLSRSSFWLARFDRDGGSADHGAHHDREPRRRPNKPDFTREGGAPEKSTGRGCSEDEKPSARELAAQSYERPCPDAHAHRDHHEVHEVDGETHGWSLRCAADTPAQNVVRFQSGIAREHTSVSRSMIAHTVTSPRCCARLGNIGGVHFVGRRRLRAINSSKVFWTAASNLTRSVGETGNLRLGRPTVAPSGGEFAPIGQAVRSRKSKK